MISEQKTTNSQFMRSVISQGVGYVQVLIWGVLLLVSSVIGSAPFHDIPYPRCDSNCAWQAIGCLLAVFVELHRYIQFDWRVLCSCRRDSERPQSVRSADNAAASAQRLIWPFTARDEEPTKKTVVGLTPTAHPNARNCGSDVDSSQSGVIYFLLKLYMIVSLQMHRC